MKDSNLIKIIVLVYLCCSSLIAGFYLVQQHYLITVIINESSSHPEWQTKIIKETVRSNSGKIARYQGNIEGFISSAMGFGLYTRSRRKSSRKKTKEDEKI